MTEIIIKISEKIYTEHILWQFKYHILWEFYQKESCDEITYYKRYFELYINCKRIIKLYIRKFLEDKI